MSRHHFKTLRLALFTLVIIFMTNNIQVTPVEKQSVIHIRLVLGSAPVIAAGWTTVQASGLGNWEWVTYADGRYTEPPGTGLAYVIADSDHWKDQSFDVGLFSPSIDLSVYTNVTVEYARNFQDYIGCGDAALRVYSGGFLELTLWSQTDDDPAGGLVDSQTFSPVGFRNPADTKLEFYYTTGGDVNCWGFGLDEVTILDGTTIIFQETFESDPFASAITPTPTATMIATRTATVTPTAAATYTPTPFTIPCGNRTIVLISVVISLILIFRLTRS